MAIGIAPVKPQKKSGIGVAVYAIAAVVVLGAGLWYWLTKTGGPAKEIELTAEARAYVESFKLADVDMKANESYFQQVLVEITGKITNAGDRDVKTVEIYCIFADTYGQLVLRK